MSNINDIELFITDIINNEKGVKINDPDINLLDTKLDINPVYFLYVFKRIEEKYTIDYDILFKKISHNDFSIRKLAKVIYQANNSYQRQSEA